MISSLLTLLVTAGASLAVSTQPAGASIPPVQHNQQFTLVAKVVKSELGIDVNNWALGGTRIGAGLLAAILKDVGPLDQEAGRMYQNGTTKDTSCSVGTNNVVAAGTGATPLSFGIHQEADPSADNSTCTISIGSGTPGVGIVNDSQGVPYFVGDGQLDGQFFICNYTFWAEPVQSLYWRSADDPAPSGCADIKLIPQCAGNLDNSTLYTQDLAPAPCLNNAVDLDAAHLTENPSGDGQVIVPFVVQG